MAIVLVGLLVVIGVVSYVLLSGGSSPKPAAGPTAHASSTPSHHPSPTPTHSSPAPPPSPAVRTLHPAGAAAFGPPGGHGDDPQDAGLAIDNRLSTAWQSDWYASSNFGNLQSGTGLLLNMGRPVTISSVMINLGATHGASLQIRTGSSAARGSLHTVATASGTGGLVRLRLSSPQHARYLLIWFTALPQDPAGTYQAKVYNVRVRGTS